MFLFCFSFVLDELVCLFCFGLELKDDALRCRRMTWFTGRDRDGQRNRFGAPKVGSEWGRGSRRETRGFGRRRGGGEPRGAVRVHQEAKRGGLSGREGGQLARRSRLARRPRSAEPEDERGRGTSAGGRGVRGGGVQGSSSGDGRAGRGSIAGLSGWRRVGREWRRGA